MDDITSRLGRAHREWKHAEKEKNARRDEFFRAVREELEQELAPQSVEQVEATNEEQAWRIAQRRFHRYRIVDVRDAKDGKWNVILEEDPEYRSYQYINPQDGQVYSKIVSENAPYLDDDALKEEEPELWDRITEPVTTRQIKPLDTLSPEDLAAMQPYITAPKPTIKLGNPRKAKPEELELI